MKELTFSISSSSKSQDSTSWAELLLSKAIFEIASPVYSYQQAAYLKKTDNVHMRSLFGIVHIMCNFFFSDELRKFTISDFPKQTHIGHILITLFFSSHSNWSTRIDIVFQTTAWASAANTKIFWWSVDQLEGVGKK